MKKLKQLLLTLGLLLVLAINAHATWSIIIIDPKTKEIGIAGGIGGIIPGKGAVVVQAASNNLIMNQADENTNAVKALRKKFDQWKDKQKS